MLEEAELLGVFLCISMKTGEGQTIFKRVLTLAGRTEPGAGYDGVPPDGGG